MTQEKSSWAHTEAAQQRTEQGWRNCAEKQSHTTEGKQYSAAPSLWASRDQCFSMRANCLQLQIQRSLQQKTGKLLLSLQKHLALEPKQSLLPVAVPWALAHLTPKRRTMQHYSLQWLEGEVWTLSQYPIPLLYVERKPVHLPLKDFSWYFQRYRCQHIGINKQVGHKFSQLSHSFFSMSSSVTMH